jgi:hypothetical protein
MERVVRLSGFWKLAGADDVWDAAVDSAAAERSDKAPVIDELRDAGAGEAAVF